ncbi:MAG: PEGA domain-containing protein [Blastocatellia bacterium]
MPAGDHMIVIKKSGYAPWERTITLSAGGTITINAELQKKD